METKRSHAAYASGFCIGSGLGGYPILSKSSAGIVLGRRSRAGARPQGAVPIGQRDQWLAPACPGSARDLPAVQSECSGIGPRLCMRL
jgi:hypothetical protein